MDTFFKDIKSKSVFFVCDQPVKIFLATLTDVQKKKLKVKLYTVLMLNTFSEPFQMLESKVLSSKMESGRN